MGDKIFSDVDLSVRVERNPRLKDHQGRETQFQGLVYTLTCQDCEMPSRVGLSWQEVHHLLKGGQLQGVTRVENGWQIVAPCGNSGEECSRKNTFLVTDHELENEANMEVSRRQRVAQAGGFRR